MIRQGHIDRIEAILVLWFAIGAKVMLNFPASLIAEGSSAGWLVIITSGLVALLGVLPGVALMRRFEGASFARAADESVGLVLGKLASLAITLLLGFIAALVTREFAEGFVIAILPRTPLVVVEVTFILVAAFSAYHGLEGIGRVSIFLAPWLLVFLMVVLVGASSEFDLRRLTPFWGLGPLDIAWDMWKRSAVYAEVVILPILYPYLRVESQARPVAVWGMALSIAVLTAVQVAVTGIFDVLNTDRTAFPIVSLARMITLGRFLTRIEAILIFLWIFVALMNVSVLVWAAVTNLAETLRLPDYQPLVPAAATIVAAGAFLPRGLRQAATLDFEFARIWAGLIAFVIPLLLWLAAVVRRKKADLGGQPGRPGGEADDAGEE